MNTSFEEFKSRIIKTDDYQSVVEDARREYKISLGKPYVLLGEDIPFNLEREYFDLLIDERRMSEARRILDRMKKSYLNPIWVNILEQYEYRLLLVDKTDSLVKKELIEAKKEFNQHTILLTSIVVGIVTIFGAANTSLNAQTFSEGVDAFFAISFAVIALVFTAFWANRQFLK